MAESDDKVFGNMPSIAEGAIGGVWDAEFDIPRATEHRSNHAGWHGRFFAEPDSILADLVTSPVNIGDTYGEPTREGLEFPDNVVLPGYAWNCQCSLQLIYDIHDVPKKYLTAMGKRAIKEGWV
jgi:hypothetical protein